MESSLFHSDLLTTHEPWRSGVSAERRWLSFSRIAALYRDVATGAGSWEARVDHSSTVSIYPVTVTSDRTHVRWLGHPGNRGRL